jgi:hypothetical protein
MNEDQIKAAKSIERALKKAGKLGLSGGVYDGTFCIWPSGSVDTMDESTNFFDDVEEHGMSLFTPGMHLDGGAGV